MSKNLKRCAMLLAAALLVLAAASASAATRYLYRESGKNITVYTRDHSEVIRTMRSGTKVETEGEEGGYTAIRVPEFVGGFGYVKSKYVVSRIPPKPHPTHKPQPHPTHRPQPQPTHRPHPQPEPEPEPDTSLDSLNRVFRTMRLSGSYTVLVRPSRQGGYVNFRYGPSSDTAAIDQLYNGHALTVIAEGNGWLQVMDPRSGRVGFISSLYVEAGDGAFAPEDDGDGVG